MNIHKNTRKTTKIVLYSLDPSSPQGDAAADPGVFTSRDRRNCSPCRDVPRDTDAQRGRSSSHAAARTWNGRAEVPVAPCVGGRGRPWAPPGARPRSRTPQQWAAPSQSWQVGGWQTGRGWQRSEGGKGARRGRNYSNEYHGTPWPTTQEDVWNKWKEGRF